MKPARRKPTDLIRLEGPMEMSTTFRTSYDVSAKEIVDVIRQKSGGRRQPTETVMADDIDVTGKVVGSHILPINHRPKTSLKTGGDGDYHTINRDSFKRFIVIDGNNNIKVPISGNADSHKADILTIDPTLTLPKVKGVENGSRRVSASNAAKSSGDEKIRVKRGTDMEMPKDEQVKDLVTAVKSKVVSEPKADEKSKKTAENKDGKVVKSNEAAFEVTVTRGRRHYDAKSVADRTRHQSLPRTKITKHKNDSQIKFVGDMDFLTESRNNYRDNTPALAAHRSHSHRDLFRTSTECDLFKPHGKNGQAPSITTYMSQVSARCVIHYVPIFIPSNIFFSSKTSCTARLSIWTRANLNTNSRPKPVVTNSITRDVNTTVLREDHT